MLYIRCVDVWFFGGAWLELQADLLWAQSPFRRRFHPKKDQIHRA
jgi:hypothetical protein